MLPRQSISYFDPFNSQLTVACTFSAIMPHINIICFLETKMLRAASYLKTYFIKASIWVLWPVAGMYIAVCFQLVAGF